MERDFAWLWENLKEGARKKFEDICYKVYKKQFPNAEVKRIRATQGDGGIAVYVECSNIRIGPGQVSKFIAPFGK